MKLNWMVLAPDLFKGIMTGYGGLWGMERGELKLIVVLAVYIKYQWLSGGRRNNAVFNRFYKWWNIYNGCNRNPLGDGSRSKLWHL